MAQWRPQCKSVHHLRRQFLGVGPGQMTGLLWSMVSAFFSLPLLKVWMELSKAARPPAVPLEEDRGGGGGPPEMSSVGGGGGGGGGGIWAPGKR